METPTAKQILEKMRLSKETAYGWQLCYDMPNGVTISVPHSSELFNRKALEEILVEKVQEAYEELV